MSLHTIGSDAKYILPASQDQVPEAFRSNRSAKPIPCSLQTVNIPSLSGSQSLGGSSVIQIPCGASAGIMMNPYIRFTVQFSSAAGVANSSFYFKGASRAATACINRLSTYVNSVQVDNLQNAWAIYDALFQHSTSNDWLTHDGTMMVGAGVQYYQPAAGATSSQAYTFCVPLLGLLGSQQSMPLYLINGTLQLQLDWASAVNACYTSGANDPIWTGAAFSNVQLVFDRIQPEQAFVDKVRSDMMAGHKYVYGYTNYATTFLNIGAGGANNNLNYGLNVSSLRGVVATQYQTANLASSADAPAISNNLSNFQLSVDGRLINTVVLDSVNTPALVFAELQKTMGRVFDASITDTAVNTATAAQASAQGNSSGGTFLLQSFAVGVSAQRVNEGLAFSGTPCSVAALQIITNATTNNITSVASTMYVMFISDFQLLIDATGSVEIVR